MIVMSVESRTIQLQDPEVPTSEKVETKTAFRTSMDGTIYGRRTSVRPTLLTYHFAALPRIKARELEDFIEAAAGKQVRLVDSIGQSWSVKVAIQSLQFATTGRGLGVGVAEFAEVTITLAGSKL